MNIKQLLDEDFVNYKVQSMLIGFPTCTFKCDKECGKRVCQNGVLANSPSKPVTIDTLVKRYLDNDISKAVVLGGLEPFDSFNDLLRFVTKLREYCEDDIVIYTGYYKEEILNQVNQLRQYKNIIIKFGRFIPDQLSHYDDVLGVNLVSDNQYAERIS